MKIVRIDPAQQAPFEGALFPNGGVARQPLVAAQDQSQLSLTLLNFAAGARNAFHTHSHDQVIVVTAGNGLVATEFEVCEVSVGDVVLFDAGEVHWHAACAACAVSFISVTPSGTTTTVTAAATTSAS